MEGNGPRTRTQKVKPSIQVSSHQEKVLQQEIVPKVNGYNVQIEGRGKTTSEQLGSNKPQIMPRVTVNAYSNHNGMLTPFANQVQDTVPSIA